MDSFVKSYDIVVFGATGYTGRLVCEYLSERHSTSGVKFAIAGRSSKKLTQLRHDLLLRYAKDGLADVGIIVSRLASPDTLLEMCIVSRICIDCVGPFVLYGTPVVEACLRGACHYIDITGEPAYVDSLLRLYHQKAVDRNILLIPNCGFDCIPADLGTLYTITRLSDPKAVTCVSDFITEMPTGISSGSAKSAFLIFTDFCYFPTFLRDIVSAWYGSDSPRNPFTSLLYGFFCSLPGVLPGPHFYPHYNNSVNGWCIPLALLDPIVVANTSRLRTDLYSQKFRFGYYFRVSNFFQFLLITFLWLLAPFLFLLGAFPLIKPLILYLLNLIPDASQDRRKRNHFRVRLVGRNKADTIVSVTEVQGPDAYVATAEMCVECAVLLLYSRDSLFFKNGVRTPASVFGLNLIDNLHDKSSIRFSHLK